MLHFGPTALHQRAAGFKCASWGEGEAKVLMASALCSQLSAQCPSQTLISQLLPNCRAHRVGLPSIWICCTHTPAPNSGEKQGDGGREPNTALGCGPRRTGAGGCGLIPFPLSSFPSPFSPLCLQSIRGTIFEVFEI